VNPSVSSAESELARVRAHRTEVRRFIQAERRAHGGKKKIVAPTAKHAAADRVLAELATCYAPGDVVCLKDICRVGHVKAWAANEIRVWARENSKWPYRSGGK
jgi:hypothetical protein